MISERGGPVAVALSGGVDSAAAAALLLNRGHRVSGLTMLVDPDPARGLEHVRAAASVASALGIRHEVLDLRAEFERAVIAPFVSGYLAGVTPNPCVACNSHIKFGFLLGRAREMGFGAFATGHYARLCPRPGGARRLLRAADADKDQSYVLWGLRREALGSLLFPLGDVTKESARELARSSGVPAVPADSQDACFIGGEGYVRLLEERAPGACRPGPVLNREGEVIGEHRGIARYTIGQRRGLGVGGPEALYVLEIRAGTNEIVAGEAEDLLCGGFRVSGLSFLSGREPAGPVRCGVRTRYRGPVTDAVLRPLGGNRAAVSYERAGPPAVPGQSAAFYRGEELLGGGVIARHGTPGDGPPGEAAETEAAVDSPAAERAERPREGSR